MSSEFGSALWDLLASWTVAQFGDSVWADHAELIACRVLQELGRYLPAARLTAAINPHIQRLTSQPSEMGALPQLYAATMPDVSGDHYWGPDGLFEQRRHPKKVGRSRAATDAETARRLWELSEWLTGVTYDFDRPSTRERRARRA